MRKPPIDLQRLLEPGEFIQWQGAPKTIFHPETLHAWSLVPFLLPVVTLLKDIWSYGLSGDWSDYIFLFLFCWGIAFADFLDDAIRNLRSYYVVTTRRVICFEGKATFTIRYESLERLDYWENRDGTGTIYVPGYHDRRDLWNRPMNPEEAQIQQNEFRWKVLNMPRPRHGLYYIENARRVYRFMEYNLEYGADRPCVL